VCCARRRVLCAASGWVGAILIAATASTVPSVVNGASLCRSLRRTSAVAMQSAVTAPSRPPLPSLGCSQWHLFVRRGGACRGAPLYSLWSRRQLSAPSDRCPVASQAIAPHPLRAPRAPRAAAAARAVLVPTLPRGTASAARPPRTAALRTARCSKSTRGTRTSTTWAWQSVRFGSATSCSSSPGRNVAESRRAHVRTSPGPSFRPHLRRDWAHPCPHLCRDWAHPRPHLRRDWTSLRRASASREAFSCHRRPPRRSPRCARPCPFRTPRGPSLPI
jgi:hypothetical protein